MELNVEQNPNIEGYHNRPWNFLKRNCDFEFLLLCVGHIFRPAHHADQKDRVSMERRYERF